MVDAQLFAEDDAAGDLSVLFMDRGKWLRLAVSSSDSTNGRSIYAAIDDLLGAATKEDFGGEYLGWGHGKAYDKQGGMHNQATEAFANMTSLEDFRRSSALVDDLVRELVPEFTTWYDELINGLNSLISGGG